MNQHIYAIPTNRECSKYIDNLLNEVRYLENKSKDRIAVVILDSSEFKSVDIHKRILKKNSDIKSNIYHINSLDLDKKLKEIFQNYSLDQKLIDLIIGSEFSYGKMNNKLAIISNALKSDFIHRRDSDTLLQEFNGQLIVPLELELKFLGKNDIYMVGSSYVGNWGIDYQRFENDPEVLLKLFSLSKPSYTYFELKDYIQNKYIEGSNSIYTGLDDISFKKANYIDAGNFSLYKIFNYFPVFPAIGVSGTDYFYHNILSLFDNSMLYHNRRVIHRYSSNRNTIVTNKEYDLAKLYSRVLTTYNNFMFNNLNKETLDISSPKFKQSIINNYKESIRSKELDVEANIIINKFKKVYIENNISDNIFIENLDNFSIIDKIKSDIRDYILLLNNWEVILEISKNQLFF